MDIHVEDLLQATIDEGASDLHIRAYMPPKLRVHGELLPITEESLTEEESLALCREMVAMSSDKDKMDEVEKNGGADFALAHPDGTRFRVSIFKVDDTVQRLIFDHAPATILRQRARELGMRTLREDGMLKVASGMTSLQEVLRVTMGDAD